MSFYIEIADGLTKIQLGFVHDNIFKYNWIRVNKHLGYYWQKFFRETNDFVEIISEAFVNFMITYHPEYQSKEISLEVDDKKAMTVYINGEQLYRMYIVRAGLCLTDLNNKFQQLIRCICIDSLQISD